MNRDTGRMLSDSDFWQICHEMHPTTNYTFPAPPKLGVANGNHDFHQCSNNNNIQSESEDVSSSSSSDGSLQNVYAKKSRAHRKLLTTHGNSVNRQKIYDTIDLFANENDKQKSLETSETSDESVCTQIQNTFDMDSNENDSIANNADDLLMRLAGNVNQLKRNVNQMSELNGVRNKNGSINALDAGDLIDFSDDWTHQGESNDNNSSHHDRDLKKVMTTTALMATTHTCVQAEDTGSSNDIIANERFPYVTYEQRNNVKNNKTEKVVNANTNTNGNVNANANEIEYKNGIDGVDKVPMMTINGGNAYNRCIEIQVNCCTEWPNRSDDENRNQNLPSPSTSSESTTSCCSSTATTSDNSIFNMRSTICSMVETNDTLTCKNGNSHTLNTEHNRPYEFEQCAYQKPNDDFDKTITKIATTSNTTGHPNVNEDILKSASPIHTFVTFTHTNSDVNNIEVDSSIQPLPLTSNLDNSICYLQQNSVRNNEGATLSAHNCINTNTNANEYKCVEPTPLAKKSSFIQPSPSNTITTVDSFRLQAEWNADKNNNPFDYKDKRTKAQLPLQIENDDFDVVTDTINKINDFQCSKQVQNNAISECSVPIFLKQPPYSRQRQSDGGEFFAEKNVILSCAASTPFAVSANDAVDIRNDGDVLDLKTKICLQRKTNKLIRCKLKYNSKWFSGERNKFSGKIQCQSRKLQTPEPTSCKKNFNKKANTLQCKLELHFNQRKSNRIGKHLKCKYKWKCCRGHLSDYDLCKTLYVTSNPNANGKKFSRKSQAIDNFCEANTVNGTNSVAKKQTKTTKKKKTSRQSSGSCTSKRSSDTKSCDVLPYKKFDAVETISSNAIACADSNLSKKCNTNDCIRPLDNNQEIDDNTSNNKNHLITENCDANIDCDLGEASDEIKSLKLSQPIEKLKQALDAVKYCSSQCIGDGDLKLNNQNDTNSYSNYTVRPTTGVNSLKNSFKLSESCESIFTLKPKPISYSSSLLSLNGDPFEASNRLRRLEERFKDFASASLGKKGRCLSINLLLSSPVSAQRHHCHTVDVQPQQQQQTQQEKPNSHSKGHSNVTENQQEQQHQQQLLATNASFECLTPSKLTDSPQVDSLNEPNCELNESVIFNDVLENCENGNVVVASNLNDGNNNHIESKTNNVNVKPIDKPIDVNAHHICCSHIIEKRCAERIQSVEQIERRKSPIGKHESTLLLVESNGKDEKGDDDIESVEKFNSESKLGTSIDANSNIKKLKYLNETASSNGLLKSDLSDTKTGRSQKDDKDEHSNINTCKSSTNNNDSSHVINENEKSVNIKGHIQFDDNKNSLEQQNHIFKDKSQESGEQLNGETDCNANDESTNEHQLNDITNRLINCTPVSVSTESEEICSLFPENRYNTNASPFIYHDEDSKTKCVFDVRQLNDNNQLPPYFDERIYECYDELDDDLDDNEIPVYGIHLNQLQGIEHCKTHNNDSIKSLRLELPTTNYCQCTIETIVPLYSEAYQTSKPAKINSKSTRTTITETAVAAAVIMRDMTSSGTLRGLLKKPNRPPPLQKNRVIFDETRNEFFDADYIILVRDECPYDEEDEEPCTCGEHELVRLCCDEGCQCAAYSEDGRTPQSPKYAPPMEFVDQAALSPPDGYKDGLQALGGVLGSHIFGAQHYQQLQVIQQLQAQRAAMIAAQRTNNNTNQKSSSKNHSVPAVPPPPPSQTVCTECAECTECAAKQEHDEALPPHMALLSIQATSPERRFTQKEIIAGEERPKYLLIKHQDQAPAAETNATSTAAATDPTAATIAAPTSQPTNKTASADPPKVTTTNTNDNENRSTYVNSDISLKPTSISAQITGILKGGKLWKNDLVQIDENTSSATSDDETFKRSVRFIDGGNPKAVENAEEQQDESQDVGDGESNAEIEQNVSEAEDTESLRKSTLFHNALMKPNSAVRQLFPSAGGVNPPQTTVLTHEALKAFDESKRSHLKATIIQHSDSDSDTIRRTIERNTLRRSLIKYEPKKKLQKPETSLEERIRQLTCDIDELQESNQTLDRRDSPTGEENPQSQNTKYVPDKSFSPSSTASSSSNSSISAYKKITDIFHKEKRQERIPEADENPIVIIPQLQQDCRCPSAPDLGVGHLPTAHNQLQSVRPSDARRQFLNSIAPLTACVAGQRDDMSFYSLAAGDRNSTGSSRCSEYSLGDIEAILRSEDAKKVRPDVIAGTPGQEHNDELAAFAQQEATRTERLKKRYSTEASTTAATSVPNSNAGSDDDEQNDYGFNHRPSVRGIKPRNNEEMLEEMQSQLSNSSVSKPPPLLPRASGLSNTLPKASTQSLQSKVMAPVQQIQQQQAQSQQQIHQSIVHQQNISTWNAYYQEQAQRNSLPANAPPVYFQHPIQARHSYHQEESTIYQNCQGVAMEQQNHYGQSMVARSPTRRPESPPPLRNYHQTMVLIPYNTESYAQFTTADQIAAQQFQHQNILEYQQVTQQTIRVPIGYPLPGMQLHVVSQNTNQPYAQYATAARQQVQMNANRPGYGYIQEASGQQAIKYSERGVPEGAASVAQSDCNNSLMSNPNLQQIGGQMVSSTANNTQTSNTSTTAQQGAVFYAMNV